MKILVTNDDSVRAPGIHALAEVASEFGDVMVMAPDQGRSGQGHAITVATFLTITEEVREFGSIEAYSCSGTPVDCVKFALHEFYEQRPDLILSGVNHGSNASVNVIYSGTMGAAIEGAMNGIHSIGFSLVEHSHAADMEPSKEVIRKVLRSFKPEDHEHAACLNVNIPYPKNGDRIKGLKWCRQADARWIEAFDKRQDPFGRQYFWLTGDFVSDDRLEGTDLWALENNFVSIVPVSYNLTDGNYSGFGDQSL